MRFLRIILKMNVRLVLTYIKMPRAIQAFCICACIIIAFAQDGKKIKYECGSFEFTDENPWRGNVRNQGHTHFGWAFATVAFVESTYRALTCNNVFLSVQQIIDGVEEYMPRVECYHNPICALKYIEKYGIMGEHQYPFTGGRTETENLYKADQIMPIKVSDAQKICTQCSDVDCVIGCIYSHLHISPIIASIDALGMERIGVDGKINAHLSGRSVNHAVVITDIILQENNFVTIQIQNSWGTEWGAAGFGYFNFSKADYGMDGPRQIFTNMIGAYVG